MDGLEIAKRRAIVETVWLLAALVATAGMMVFLAGVALVATPLQHLIDKTRRVAAGDLSQPLELMTGDELSELATSLNEMCARLENSQRKVTEETAARVAALEQLRHDDRLRTVGRLASGIAHELGTPLNVISGRSDLIASQQVDVGQQIDSARIIKQEAERMTTIIRQLLAYARRGEPSRTEITLNQVVEPTINLLSSLAAKHEVDLHFQPECESCRSYIDMGQIQQVLTNVIMNAVQASSANGSIEVRLLRQQVVGSRSTSGDYAVISVKDHGSGIAESDLEQVFEPFYTTKDAGDGTGLGLSIAQRIIDEHGGWIDVESQLEKGSTFRIYLPCVK
jgi:signal transduction histidine kinase